MEKKKSIDFLILRERLLSGRNFNRFLLGIVMIVYIYSTEIANYHTTVNEAWWRWKNLLMADFSLLVFALRREIQALISLSGYKVVLYTLLNYFFDQYYGLKGWSWNDYLTIIVIGAESLFLFFVKMRYKFKI